MAIMKILVAFFEARIFPLAKSARVTPTTETVASVALHDDAGPDDLEERRDATDEEALERGVGEDQRGADLLARGERDHHGEHEPAECADDPGEQVRLELVVRVLLGSGDAAEGHDPADGCGDEQDAEESGGLPDGVFDRHAIGLDGAGRGSRVHALQLRVRSGIHRAVLERRGLCTLSALRGTRVGRDITGVLLLERRVVEGEVAHVGLTPKWVVGLFPPR